MTPPPDWFDADEAQQLLRHLEWQPEGFSLLFVFADALPAQWLADWLNAALRPAGLTLQQPTCAQQLADAPDAVVDALMAELGALAQAPGAVWLPLHHYPQHADWDAARRKLLARLNERRFLLERDLPRPLLLVLPANFRPITREIAPDIWHIRVLSQQWKAPLPRKLKLFALERLPVPIIDSYSLRSFTSNPYMANHLAELWHKDKTSSHQRFLATAWQFADEAIPIGRIKESWSIVQEAISTSRERVAQGDLDAEFELVLLLERAAWLADIQDKPAVSEVYAKEFYDWNVKVWQRNKAHIGLIEPTAEAICNYGYALLKNNKISEVKPQIKSGLPIASLLYGFTSDRWARIILPFIFLEISLAVKQEDLHTLSNAIKQSWMVLNTLPEKNQWQREFALTHHAQAICALLDEDWPAAEQALAKSVAIFRQLAAAPRAPRHAREDLAIALARQALLPPGDLAPLQEAERILLQLCAEFVEVPAYPRELDAIRELAHLLASSVAHSG